MAEVKKTANNGILKVGRTVTKTVLGITTSIGAGALAAAGLKYIPADSVKGLGKLFAGIGACGIGLAVSDAAAGAMERKTDEVFDAVEMFVNFQDILDKVDEVFDSVKKAGEEDSETEEQPVEEGEFKEV